MAFQNGQSNAVTFYQKQLAVKKMVTSPTAHSVTTQLNGILIIIMGSCMLQIPRRVIIHSLP